MVVIAVMVANAVVAFFVLFYLQAKVIFTIYRASRWDDAYVPWKALSDPKSPQVNFGRFFAGEIFPDLRRKWGKAWAYAICSFLALFTVAGFLGLFAPDLIR